MRALSWGAWAGAALLAFSAVAVRAQTTEQEIQQYRRMVGEDNPGDLWVIEGEKLFKEKRGPKHASLERCDFGLGPGVLKGAYAHLPRYFADTGRVQDMESRLVTCMMTLQGFSEKEATKRVFGNADNPSDIEYLSAYIASKSRGVPMQVRLGLPQERRAYEIGKAIFFYRAGAYDFSCATCHGEKGKRIRLQELPDLATPAGARPTYTTWPGYRVSNSQLKTMEWRLTDCFRQQRMPMPRYGSEALVDVTMYLAVSANGAKYEGPGMKR
jgi:L-cysteine S-thiosulfotransferase